MKIKKARHLVAAAALVGGLGLAGADTASAHGYVTTPFSNTNVRKGPGGSNCYGTWGLTATQTHSNLTSDSGCSYTACGGTSSLWLRVYSVLGDPGWMARLCVTAPVPH